MLIAFFVGLVVGFGAGFLCFRNNAEKFKALEDELKRLKR